ncbi:MAG: hypothetical protein SFT94_02900 [Pseudanabaenaceae cyanobacterium bins.68]|nr:hypothetical protein [Pseudanabaenaceae cyanobacterium bins.68]
MANPGLLEEVIDAIQQDENLMRIKRLIVFSCHGFWVEDPNDLESMELRTLIEELLAAIPDVDTLKHMLNSSVKKLSKPEVYALVADMIIDSIGLLYPMSTKPVQGFSLPHTNFALIDQGSQPTQVSTVTSDDSTAIERKTERLVGRKFEQIPNIFDLKLDIFNNVAPLRAKILVFSLLHYRFDPLDRSWNELTTHDFSELLQSLYQWASNLEALEQGLKNTATELGGEQEYLQAAGVIGNFMKPLYFS